MIEILRKGDIRYLIIVLRLVMKGSCFNILVLLIIKYCSAYLTFKSFEYNIRV